MAQLAAAQVPIRHGNSIANATVPMTPITPWVTVIPAGGCDDLDAATITNPDVDMVTNIANRRIVNTSGIAGTNWIFRLAVPTATTTGTMKISVWVATQDGVWCRAKTKDGSTSLTFDVSTYDYNDGTYNYTAIDLNKAFDNLGCDRMTAGVETVLTGGTTAFVQAKSF